MKLPAAIIMMLLAVSTAEAVPVQSPETPTAPLTCGGDEPYWSLRLGADGKARFSDGDGETSTSRFTMQQSRNTTLIAGAIFGPKADISAVISHETCSVTASDDDKPLSISVWYKGSLLSGCCQPG
ncbi:hypothetical protein OIU35_26265 [Boseaceae bacterium BT-24-1]|nr:hypothetical protein [Boseaceae bacterium BT-24-1]